MKIIITAIVVVTAILTTIQSVTASTTQYGNWTYIEFENDFDGDKEYLLVGKGTANRKHASLGVIIKCTHDQFEFIIRALGIRLQKAQQYMRIRVDNREPETYKIGQVNEGEGENIYIESILAASHFLNEMVTGSTTTKFEIFDYQNLQIIFTASLEGFTKAWKRIKPHCPTYNL